MLGTHANNMHVYYSETGKTVVFGQIELTQKLYYFDFATICFWACNEYFFPLQQVDDVAIKLDPARFPSLLATAAATSAAAVLLPVTPAPMMLSLTVLTYLIGR